MAKKAQPVEDNEAVVVSNVLITVENVDVEIEKAKAEITQLTPQDYIDQIKTQYMAMKLDQIEDMTAYTTVVDGIQTLKKLCTSIAKRRKAITDPAFKFQKDVKEAADDLIAQIVPITKHLESEKTRFDDAVIAKQNKIFIERCATLDQCGYQLTGGYYVCGVIQIHTDNLRTITDEQFQFYVTEGNKELERRKAEEERKAQEQAELQLMRAEINAERERIAQERAEMQKLRAEIEAQKQAMEAQYEKADEAPAIPNDPPIQPESVAPVQEQAPVHRDVDSEVKEAMMRAMGVIGDDVPDGNTPRDTHQPHVVYTSASPGEPKERMIDMTWLNGFNEFRRRLIEEVSDPNKKLTRAILREWAEKQRP